MKFPTRRSLGMLLALLVLPACEYLHNPFDSAPGPGAKRIQPVPVLMHRYSFSDGVKDSVGGVNGILKNSAKVVDGKLVLDNGTKSSPDETLAYVEFPAPLIPKVGSTSIVFWFTAKDVQSFARVIDFGNKEGTEGMTFIYYTPNNGGASRAAITGTDVSSKSNVDSDPTDDGKPHMVAIIVDGASRRLLVYVDGKPASDVANLGDNTLDKVHPVHSWVGRSAFDADGGLTASIDELRVYSIALSPVDVAAMSAAGPDKLP